MATVAGNAIPQTVGQLELTRFPNEAGLNAQGDNLYLETPASGSPQSGVPGSPGYGTIQQGFLETSNVNSVDEITSLITAQRAYEMNSKVISAADQMLQNTALPGWSIIAMTDLAINTADTGFIRAARFAPSWCWPCCSARPSCCCGRAVRPPRRRRRPSHARIVVPTRDLNRGEVIGRSDLTYAEITGTALSPSTATKFETLTGMQSRRLLRAGRCRPRRGCPPSGGRYQRPDRHHDLPCARSSFRPWAAP